MRTDRLMHCITLVVAVFMFGGAIYMRGFAGALPKGLGPSALGPGTFPLFVLYATMAGSFVLGVWTLLGLLRSSKDERVREQLGAQPAKEASVASPVASSKQHRRQSRPLWRIVGVVAAFTTVIAVWHWLGFLATSALFIGFTSYFLGEPDSRSLKNAGMSALWALGFTGAIWLVFVKLLNVPLPGGTFIEW